MVIVFINWMSENRGKFYQSKGSQNPIKSLSHGVSCRDNAYYKKKSVLNLVIPLQAIVVVSALPFCKSSMKIGLPVYTG